MKRADRLAAAFCLAEIESVVVITKKPMPRKAWLTARKWYRFQKDLLTLLGYKKKIVRLPKHVLKVGVITAV